MAPSKKSTKAAEEVIMDDTEATNDEGERWNVKQLFQEIYPNRFPKLLPKKEDFIVSGYWNDIYKLIMDYTINRSDYKGFPTKTSYKNYSNAKCFPNTSTAERNDVRFPKMLDNFVNEFNDNLKDSVDNYIVNGSCDVSTYVWKSKDSIAKILNESSIKETSQTEEHTTKIPSTSTRKEATHKRKYEDISESTVFNYMESVAACLKLEKDNKDYEMKTSLSLLNELNEIISNNSIDDLQHELEEENQCFNYCMQFFKKRITQKTARCTTLTKNFKELQNLQASLSTYLTKRREKMTSEREKKKNELDDLIQKLITEEDE